MRFVKTVSRRRFMTTSRDVIGREREHRTILYVMGSHVLSAVSCHLVHYSESVGTFVRELQCIPLLGNIWFAAVQKLPRTAWLFYVSWCVCNIFGWFGQLAPHGVIHEACSCYEKCHSFQKVYVAYTRDVCLNVTNRIMQSKYWFWSQTKELFTLTRTHTRIQSVPGGTDQTSGGCSLC
jgi:hypothetical protein